MAARRLCLLQIIQYSQGQGHSLWHRRHQATLESDTHRSSQAEVRQHFVMYLYCIYGLILIRFYQQTLLITLLSEVGQEHFLFTVKYP
jgi:hypothetical protein